MTSTNSIHDPFRAAFQSVIQEFRSKLNNDAIYQDILQTKNIDEVYSVTQRLQEEQSHKGRMRHMAKMGPFLEALRSYASVIEVFMQAKPDVLALVWGPIKLIIQWADVLKQSMDAIINTTSEIGERLPEFRQAVQIFKDNNLISDVLILFFRDIMDFYLIALKLFSSPRLKLVFEAMWPRQRSKINCVIENIERHTRLLRNEVRLELIQEEFDFRRQALEKFERAEISHLRQEYQGLRTDIAPRTYEDKLAYLSDRTCREAALWLTQHDAFRDWIDPTKQCTGVLWLQGIPGSGKTYLAGTVVHETQKRGHSLFAFLSFDLSKTTSVLSILHSWIFQLTTDDPDLQSILCNSGGKGFRRDVDLAQGIFKTLILSAGQVYISLDGLDETDIHTRRRILSMLLQLSEEIDYLRVVISCRPEADLTRLLRDKATVISVNEKNRGGVESYVLQRTAKWYEERGFYPDARKEIEASLAPLASKCEGMFLYAKIVLDTVELLEADEIMQDLKVLPESMDDAYGRVLNRINNLDPPILTARARSIIGWVGVSPTPLTIRELEQALVVDAQDREGMGEVTSELLIVQLCGPILEIVDDYVQFVHFTVYEYFLSPRINSSIDPQQSRSSLAACCLRYLCQCHHDPSIDNETVSRFILKGLYRLHSYASSFWLKLIEDTSSGGADALSDELVHLLGLLYCDREPDQVEDNHEINVQGAFRFLKERNLELYQNIGRTVAFQDECSDSAFKLNKDDGWTKLDPLGISRTSCQVYQEMENLLHPRSPNREITRSLQRHYGKRAYKCAHVNCAFKRKGFESRGHRKLHENSHATPWHCSFPGCEFIKGGFLSQKMRDDHLDRFHSETNALICGPHGALDEEDFRSVCLDLVRVDDIEGTKSIILGNESRDWVTIRDIMSCAARFASPEMITVLGRSGLKDRTLGRKAPFYYEDELFEGAVQGKNDRVLEYLWHLKREDFISMSGSLTIGEDVWGERGYWLSYVLKRGSQEMVETVYRWVDRHNSREDIFKAYLVQDPTISATKDDPYREQILLELWRRVPNRFWNKHSWKNALPNVASTTCSEELAKFSLEKSIPVDWRANETCPTPLLHATRKTTAAAANLSKLLLFHGANTTVQMQVGRSTRDRKNKVVSRNMIEVKVSDQKGAQEIQQWLGVTWDELVAQAAQARQLSTASVTEDTS